MEKRTSKLQVYLNDTELKAIDEWRFKYRLPSRAAAIRALIGKGLFGTEPDTKEATPSRKIGVVPEAAQEE